MPQTLHPYRSDAIFYVAAVTLATLVGGSVYVATRPAVTVVAPPAVFAPTTRPIALVVDAARQLKLVTWSFDTTVEARSVSDKWYGDAVASVRAPVTYQYGVDLDRLRTDDVLIDGPSRYVFIVPPPRRISVEVDVAKLEQTLRTSGVRWRSTNQDQLDAGRRALGERAQAMQLADADVERLRDVSREQVESLLRRVIGGSADVSVRFAD